MTQLKQKAAERTERSDNIERKQKLGVKQQLLHYFFTVKKKLFAISRSFGVEILCPNLKVFWNCQIQIQNLEENISVPNF